MNKEKYAATWLDIEHDAKGHVVFENYQESTQTLSVVFERIDGLFIGSLYDKSKDPHDSLPHWAEANTKSIFGSKDEAIKYLNQLSKNAL